MLFDNKECTYSPEDIAQLTFYYGGYAGYLRVFPRKVEGGGRNFIFIRDCTGVKHLYRIILPSKADYNALKQIMQSAKYNFRKQEMPEQEAALWQLLS